MLRKITVLGLFTLLASPYSLAEQKSVQDQIQEYEQTHLKLNYQGEVGHFLQTLANRLNVGFITFGVDPTKPLQIEEASDITVSTLLAKISNSMPEAEVKFQKIGDRIYIVLASKGFTLEPKTQVVNQALSSNVITTTETNKEQTSVINAGPLKTPSLVNPIESNKDLVKTEINDEQGKKSITDNAETVVKPLEEQTTPMVEQPIEPVVKNQTTEQPKAQVKFTGKEATQAIEDIVSQATNKSALDEKIRITPKYRLLSKEKLGLQKVRVTPLATFLIFNNQIDTTKFDVENADKFEKLVQAKNMIAILHKDNPAPKMIVVTDQNGNKLELSNTVIK